MERKVKYGVFSLKDTECLTEDETEQLEYLLAKMRNNRINVRNKPHMDCVVLERRIVGDDGIDKAYRMLGVGLETRAQRRCDHLWESKGGGMQLVESVCLKCGKFECY